MLAVHIRGLVDSLARAADTMQDVPREVVTARLLARGKRWLARRGLPCVPVGAGNAKTGVPSTYRAVGPTCGPCPHEATCYADRGRTGIHSRHSDRSVEAAVYGAALASTVALLTGTLARLHVSGDGGQAGEDFQAVEWSPEYIQGLTTLRLVLLDAGLAQPDRPHAWGYTRLPCDPVEFQRLGIAMRRSGYRGALGAVVVRDWSEIRTAHEALRASLHPAPDLAGPRPMRCREQLDGTPCRDCGLCWTRPDRAVAFLAHGSGARDVVSDLQGP